MLMRNITFLIFYRPPTVSILVSFENYVAALFNARFILHGRRANYYIDAVIVILAKDQNLLEAIL